MKQNEKTTSPPPDTPEQLEPVRGSRLSSIGLPMVLAVSIGIALLLTSISVGLYFASNLSRIDLSKPKYADIREDVLNGGETQDEALDRDSPLTSESVGQAIEEMQSRRSDLRQLGGFDTSILDNSQLGIDAKTPKVQ